MNWGTHVSFDVPFILRGRSVVLRVTDLYIQDGDLTDDDELLPDELIITYKVFDVEEEAELLQLTPEEREACYKAILKDLEDLCGG